MSNAWSLRNDGQFPIYTPYANIPFRGGGIGSSIRQGFKSLLPSGLKFMKEVVLPEALNVASRVAKGERLKDVGKEALKRTGKTLGKRVVRGAKKKLLGGKRKNAKLGRRKTSSIKGTKLKLSKSQQASLRRGVAKALNASRRY